MADYCKAVTMLFGNEELVEELRAVYNGYGLLPSKYINEIGLQGYRISVRDRKLVYNL